MVESTPSLVLPPQLGEQLIFNPDSDLPAKLQTAYQALRPVLDGGQGARVLSFSDYDETTAHGHIWRQLADSFPEGGQLRTESDQDREVCMYLQKNKLLSHEGMLHWTARELGRHALNGTLRQLETDTMVQRLVQTARHGLKDWLGVHQQNIIPLHIISAGVTAPIRRFFEGFDYRPASIHANPLFGSPEEFDQWNMLQQVTASNKSVYVDAIASPSDLGHSVVFAWGDSMTDAYMVRELPNRTAIRVRTPPAGQIVDAEYLYESWQSKTIDGEKRHGFDCVLATNSLAAGALLLNTVVNGKPDVCLAA